MFTFASLNFGKSSKGAAQAEITPYERVPNVTFDNSDNITLGTGWAVTDGTLNNSTGSNSFASETLIGGPLEIGQEVTLNVDLIGVQPTGSTITLFDGTTSQTLLSMGGLSGNQIVNTTATVAATSIRVRRFSSGTVSVDNLSLVA